MMVEVRAPKGFGPRWWLTRWQCCGNIASANVFMVKDGEVFHTIHGTFLGR